MKKRSSARLRRACGQRIEKPSNRVFPQVLYLENEERSEQGGSRRAATKIHPNSLQFGPAPRTENVLSARHNPHYSGADSPFSQVARAPTLFSLAHASDGAICSHIYHGNRNRKKGSTPVWLIRRSCTSGRTPGTPRNK